MTFQYGQITASSPLALSASFRAPLLNRSVTSAVVTIRQALEQLPAEVPTETLEQVALREKAREVIAAAEQRLSKPMYDAFLLWGELGAAYSAEPGEETSGEANCAAFYEAVREVEQLTAITRDDILFKAYLTAVELVDLSGAFGPLVREPNERYVLDRSVIGMIGSSEVLARIDELSRMELVTTSGSYPWPTEAGAVVADEFAKARAKHIRGQSALELLIDELLHLDRLTRELDLKDDDPINQLHLDAEDDFLAFRPTDVTQILRKIDVMSQRGCNLAEYVEEFLVRDLQALAVDALADGDDDSKRAWKEAFADYKRELASCEAAPADDPNVDELVDQWCRSMDRLINEVPAPDWAAVTIKLEVALSRAETLGETLFTDHAKAIAADARRLGAAAGVEFGSILERHQRIEQPTVKQAA